MRIAEFLKPDAIAETWESGVGAEPETYGIPMPEAPAAAKGA